MMKKLKLNSSTAMINQLVVLISGLILPRFILNYYGSDTNGLISSITQFLNIISFLELGVGAVVQSALYRPLAQEDKKQLSIILSTARYYFKNIAKVLLIYVVFLMIMFPTFINSPLDRLSTAFLIIAISISSFGQYYYGIVNQLILNADQKNYIHISVQIISVVLNLVASIVLIMMGSSVQIVKFVSGLIFLARPLFLNYYVRINYDIDYKQPASFNSIPQFWNGIAQHVSFVVTNSSDVVILTMFSTLENVSIYSVYNMVVSGVKMLITSLTTGLQSFFGNLYAKNMYKELNDYFSQIEWLVHTLVTLIFGLTILLINSFIAIYTKGITDVSYSVPVFSFMITLSQAIYCIRLPYNSMVLAAGHYKETQTSSIIEAFINVLISIVLLFKFGLVGVALGTILAMSYRTVYLVIYLTKNILFRPINSILKQLVVDGITLGLMFFISNTINIVPINFKEWVLLAMMIGIISLLIALIINVIFYRQSTLQILNRVKNYLFSRK